MRSTSNSRVSVSRHRSSFVQFVIIRGRYRVITECVHDDELNLSSTKVFEMTLNNDEKHENDANARSHSRVCEVERVRARVRSLARAPMTVVMRPVWTDS